MKLVRFRHGGDAAAKLGAVVGDSVIDLRGAYEDRGTQHGTALPGGIPDSMRAFLAGGEAARKAAEDAIEFAMAHPHRQYEGLPIVTPLASVQLLAPIADPLKIMCIGQNYRDHCEEQNQPIPERAILFAKFPNTINDPGAPIVLPAVSTMVDYEAELAVVIGKRAKHVSESDARQYVAGYTCLNDVSARDIQLHPAEKQWVRGKTSDTFAPIGPMLVTADEIADPQDLDISLTLNGESMQSSNTSNLIFGIDYLVSYLSRNITLEPGDIISTGTPGGVGMYRSPQVFLKPGDVVSVTIEHIGTLTNPVVADR